MSDTAKRMVIIVAIALLGITVVTMAYSHAEIVNDSASGKVIVRLER